MHNFLPGTRKKKISMITHTITEKDDKNENPL